jgi:hypothetical protein
MTFTNIPAGPFALRATAERAATPVKFSWAGRLLPEHQSGIVGSLVHSALRRWRFPGDRALDRLLKTALAEMACTDSVMIHNNCQEAN